MESCPISEQPATNWLDLPDDLMTTILLKLCAFDILVNVQNVCSSWRRICKDPFLWRVVDIHYMDSRVQLRTDRFAEMMCMQAVNLSCGQLVDINIESFGTDDLLLHISQSSRRLRRLRIVCCSDISADGITKAALKFPLLQHLEISGSAYCLKTLATVGCCCPRLKTLKLNYNRRRSEFERDEEALAIAENMPNLRNLQIRGNLLTEWGLQAILDGCPHLEYLDLRWCYHIGFAAQMNLLRSGKIKSFNLPGESFDESDSVSETFSYVGGDSDDNFSDDFDPDTDYFDSNACPPFPTHCRFINEAEEPRNCHFDSLFCRQVRCWCLHYKLLSKERVLGSCLIFFSCLIFLFWKCIWI
ncbi:putative F-box/LRR-repeat protein 9 [Cucurbita pepo subsp. pepo]|uniref:putative F-box/LRR-repeat protein 9 n=1 Tax=Cucurbita pepo subsp. pepo TaxID=3664 RepID=UPI000C9D5430|nr:putative F-box/LRR-repeat protein 9 [Cucurbita pepo subsp. pepo]